MSMYTGHVKWFDAKKGYGFILHPNDESDIFVHYSQILSNKRFKTLRTGELVEFDLVEGPKGLHAHNVTISDSSSDSSELVESESTEEEEVMMST